MTPSPYTRIGTFLLMLLTGALGLASTPSLAASIVGPSNPCILLSGQTTCTTISLVTPALENVAVFPNPWRADQNTGNLIFSGVPLASNVKIFTVSGHFVTSVQESGTSQAHWDLTNAHGENVSSGLYLYLITDPQGRKAHGKFAVIR